MCCFLIFDKIYFAYYLIKLFTGKNGGMFISRRQILKPGEKLVTTRPPEIYTFNDLYIENIICLEEFDFAIIASDEYTLRYMEIHPNEVKMLNSMNEQFIVLT